jgi:hypothetical protein
MLEGNIRKMKTTLEESGAVTYELPVGDELLPMNRFIGKELSFEFSGQINCISCEAKTKKTFGGGFCYPCFMSLPQADMCVMKPETCHFHLGTCRDEEWGMSHCMIPHTVYLANSSGLKVGITREAKPTTRWMDQGAVQAIALGTVQKRLDSGKIEVELKKHVSDKTNWRKMLKGEVDDLDLKEKRKELLEFIPSDVEFTPSNDEPVNIAFPVEVYPEKIKSFNLDKDPNVKGVLNGIKGQYLIFDTGVINMRKYAGYKLKFHI